MTRHHHDMAVNGQFPAGETLEVTRLRVENQQLRIELTQALQAMAAREVIEQAKGLLLGHYRCEPAQAFTVLRELSQRTNTKLREVAIALVETAAAEGRVHYPGLDSAAEHALGSRSHRGFAVADPGPAGWQ